MWREKWGEEKWGGKGGVRKVGREKWGVKSGATKVGQEKWGGEKKSGAWGDSQARKVG